MKIFLTAISLIFIIQESTYSQKIILEEKFIYTNEIKASMMPAGHLFWNLKNSGFQFPGHISVPNKKTHTIFAQGTWISAVDENANKAISGVTYGQEGSDFIAGPIDLEANEGWIRVFKVSAYEINALIKDFEINGQIDNVPARSLLEWPAKGNPHFSKLTGLELPNREMAPFFDRLQNGSYDPYEGDYPILGYDCADVIPIEMGWTLYHDKTIHGFSNSPEILNVEVATTVFSFGYLGIDVLDKSVFVRQELRNRSNKDLYDFRLGHFVDLNIGCAQDDAIGCDPGQNTFFGYNGKELDNSTFCQGVPSYHYFSPVQTVTFLNHSLSSFISYSPEVDIESRAMSYNRLLHGIWKDGVPITAAGNGYNTSGPVTTYLYSDPPSDANGWSLMTDTATLIQDFRGLGAIGIDTLLKNDFAIVYTAYTVHHKDSLNPVDQVDFAMDRIPIVQEFFDNCFESAGGMSVLCDTICVWPGDMDNNGMVNNIDVLSWGLRLGKSGQPREHLFSGWLPQFADDWGTPDNFPIHTQHMDADGNGQIETSDYNIIDLNYGLTNNSNVAWGGYNLPGNELWFERIFDSATGYDTIVSPGKTFKSRLHFQNPTTDPVYGLAFSIRFDTSVVNWQNSTPIINWINSPFITNAQRFVRVNPNGLDVGITRKDGKPVSVQDISLFDIAMRVTSEVIPYPITAVQFQNYQLINASGDNIVIGSKELDIQFGQLSSVDNLGDLQQIAFRVFPNPGNDFVYIEANEQIEFIEFMSIEGMGMFRIPGVKNTFFLANTESLPEGLYLVKVCQGQGHCGIKKWVKFTK